MASRDADENTSYLLIVIFLILAIIAAFVSYYFITSVINGNTASNNNTNKISEGLITTTTTTIFNVKTTNNSNLDVNTMIDYNNKMKNYVIPIMYLLDITDDGNILNNIEYNTNVLNNYDNKFKFAIGLMMSDSNFAKTINNDGTVTCGYSAFESYFQNIYNESFDINKISSDLSVNGDTINISYNTNIMNGDYMDLKAVSVDNKDSNLEVLCDMLVYDKYENGVHTIDSVSKEVNSDPTIIDYDDTLSFVKVEFTFDSANHLKKLTFREKQ